MSVDQAQLKRVLGQHSNFLNGRSGGQRADLSFADLSRPDSSGAELRQANLTGTVMRDTNCRGATLEDACLFAADCRRAKFGKAN